MASFAAFNLALPANDHILAFNVQEHIVNRSLVQFVHLNNLPLNRTTAFIWLFYFSANRIEANTVTLTAAILADWRIAADNTAAMCIQTADGVLSPIDAATVAALPDALVYRGISKRFIQEISYYNAAFDRFTFDLAVAAAHKPILARNIVSYFQQFEIVIEESLAFEVAVNRVARVRRATLLVDDRRIAISNTMWGKYRLSATSVPQAYRNFLSTYGDVVTNRLLSPAEVVTLDNIVLNPWNKALVDGLNPLTVGIIAAGLRASRSLDPQWVSGNRKLNAMSSGMRIKYITFFEEFLLRTSNVERLRDAATIDAMMDVAGL